MLADFPPESAFIALGSNLDSPLKHLRRAAQELADLGRVTGRSSLYRTEPVGGPEGQPAYLNAVVVIEPRDPYADPERLLAALLALEARHGRVRWERWAARSLDLDLLAYGERVLRIEGLELPHPRMMERAFVLAPLCELAPGWRHPVSGQGACGGLAEGVERTDLGWD